MKDGEPRLEVRGLDVCDQAPFETRSESVLEGWDLLRWAVRRDDDLLVDLMQRIEGVKKLFFRAVLAGQELHVVDEQHVDRAVLVPELSHSGGGDRADDLVGELLGCEVDDSLARKAVMDFVADGVHEVGFAESHASVQEQRVVAVAGRFRDCLRGRMCELRVVPDHER